VKGKMANGVDISSNTFYKRTPTFQTSPPVRHCVPSHFNWTVPELKCTVIFRMHCISVLFLVSYVFNPRGLSSCFIKKI